MQWDDSISKFMQHQRAAGRPETTIRLRYFHLRHLAKTVPVEPGDVTTDHLVTYLAELTVTSSTKRAVRTSIRAYFTWATLAGVTDHDPSAELPTISAKPGRARPAPEDAIAEALRTADERVSLMIRLAAWQGLRCREIARVHTRDVNHDRYGWTLTIHGKGDRQRIIPLLDELAREIRAHGDGYVFPGRHDGHLSPQYVSRLISQALPAGVTGHMLRHRFATTSNANAGGDIRVVQELLGHASVATTQIYTATSTKALRRAVRSGRRALVRFRIAEWMTVRPRAFLERMTLSLGIRPVPRA